MSDFIFSYPDRFVFEWQGRSVTFYVRGGRVTAVERYETRRTTRDTRRSTALGGVIATEGGADAVRDRIPSRRIETREITEAQSHWRGFVMDTTGRERPVSFEIEVRRGHSLATIATRDDQPVARVNLSTEHWAMLCGPALIESLFCLPPIHEEAEEVADRPGPRRALVDKTQAYRGRLLLPAAALIGAALIGSCVVRVLPVIAAIASGAGVLLLAVVATAAWRYRSGQKSDAPRFDERPPRQEPASAASDRAAAITGRIVLTFVDHHVSRVRA